MTGTQSEPTKELHDDLADEGAKSPPPADDAPGDEGDKAPEAAGEGGEGEDRPERPRKKKRRAAPPPERPKSKPFARILAAVVLLGIPLVLIFSGQRQGGGGRGSNQLPASTKWAVGSEQSIDVTLVPQDRTNLACSSPNEVAGKKCEFEGQKKRAGALDEKLALKPYRLAGSNDPALIAGLWTDPALRDPSKLPGDRFTARCKFKVEGKVGKLEVRWNPNDQWFPEPFDWPSGTVSNCTIVK